MKLIIILSVLILCEWSHQADPPRPELSSTCFFMYNASTMGDPTSPQLIGYFGAIYEEEGTQNMQVFNQSEIFNGTKRRHDYVLDRMDMGVEYYMNWTRGMPDYCEQNDQPGVIDVWEDLDLYEFNGTKTFMGKQMNIWKYDIGQGETTLIGVSVDDNTVPLMFAQVIRRRSKVVVTHYAIKNYTKNPKEAIFNIPKICQQRSMKVDAANVKTKPRRSVPFTLF